MAKIKTGNKPDVVHWTDIRVSGRFGKVGRKSGFLENKTGKKDKPRSLKFEE